MAGTKKNNTKSNVKIRAPMTQEANENQMIALSMELAKQQLMDGTASSQVITHFLKLGSTKERLERERLEEENKLLRAKTEMLESSKRAEELYSEAIAAFNRYSGHPANEENYE